MGNELFSQYSIEKNHFLTGGHLNLWKIYKGSHKVRKAKVCVFVFEKKTLDQFPRGDQDSLLNIMKNEASSLTKYKHPNMLSIVEPLIEDKYSIGFITEDIAYTLVSWVTSSSISKLQIKMLMGELCSTILFLHKDCNIIHSNLNPNGIFISNDLHIKVSQLNFTLTIGSMQDLTCSNFNRYFLNRNLSYAAPEIVFQAKGSSQSDTFSIGAILCFLLKSLTNTNNNSNDREILHLDNNTPDDYKRAMSNGIESNLNKLFFDNKTDKEMLIEMLKKDDKTRMPIEQLLEQDFFTDCQLKALQFISNIPTNDVNKNIEFFQLYQDILSLFEHNIIINQFLPALLDNLKIEKLTNSILPAIFATCEHENISINFSEAIWPKLKEMFQMKTIPAASLYFLLLKITYIADKISPLEFSTHCLSIICKAMDCGVVKIQSAVADVLSFVTLLIEASTFKNQIYPRLIQILLMTKSNGLKVKLLNVLKDIGASLDPVIINESLLEQLDRLLKKDVSCSVCENVIKIYEAVEKVVSIAAIVKKILPSLTGILVNGAISSDLFDKVGILMQTFVLRIKQAREKDLMKNNEEEADKGNDCNVKVGEDKTKAGEGKRKEMTIQERERFLDKFFKGTAEENSKNDQNKEDQEVEFEEFNQKEDEYPSPKSLIVNNEGKKFKATTQPLEEQQHDVCFAGDEPQLDISQNKKGNKESISGNTVFKKETQQLSNDLFNDLIKEEPKQDIIISKIKEKEKQVTETQKKFDKWDDESNDDMTIENNNPPIIEKDTNKNKTKDKNKEKGTIIKSSKSKKDAIINLDSLLDD